MTTTTDRPAVADAKRDLRAAVRARRADFVAGLAPVVRSVAFRALPGAVLERIAPDATVALYHAVGDEAPTNGIVDQLVARGNGVALPSIDRLSGVLAFVRWHPDEILVPGPFRTLQPGPDAPAVAPDVLIAPLVAFDARMNRLGQGGGYYDRAFALFPDALRIGLAWSVQQVEAVAVDAHDAPLHLVLTERAIIEPAGASA